MPYQRIFLLSHMRAYTSLLGHILGSHPQINGYYEMHLDYQSVADLARQEQFYSQQDSLKPDSHYLFDKLLHNDYGLNLPALGQDDAIILLALRQPEPAIKSILSLFMKKDVNALYAQPVEATTYYIERLARLDEFSQQYPQRYYYFDAELIRTDTDRTLAKLREWLRLESPLSAHYQKFAKTGLAGAGDTSPVIQSGEVIRQENQYPDIVLKSELLEPAIRAYQECRKALARNALAACAYTNN